MSGAVTRWYQRTTDARSLALTRILLGSGSALAALDTFERLFCVLGRPCLRAPLLGLPEVSLPSLMTAVTVWGSLSVFVVLGVAPRLSAALTVPLIGYFLLLDEQFYSNHLHLAGVMMALLSLSQCEAALSLRALRGPTLTRVPAWPAELMMVQITILYVFAALSKINGSFLRGEVLALFVRPWALSPLGPRGAPILAVLAIVIEFSLPVLLWSRRVKWGVLTGLLMHTSFIITMGWGVPSAMLQFTSFTLLAAGAYPLFLAASISGGAPTPSRR